MKHPANGIQRPLGVYSGTRAVGIQNYTEANVKLGRQFLFFHEIDIASGETKYISITTPTLTDDQAVIVKSRMLTSDGGFRYTPWRGATFTKGAPIITSVNLNDRAPNADQMQYFEVTGTPDTSTATKLDAVRSAEGVGNNRQLGIFDAEGTERHLRKGEDYLLQFDNTDNKAIFVIIALSHYEGFVDFAFDKDAGIY